MSSESTHDNRNAEVVLRERMASIEAKQVFHQETLKGVSESLHEVVKTQHILANQSKEITRIVETLNHQQEDVASLKKDAEMAHLRSEYLEDKVKLHGEAINHIKDKEIEALKQDVQTNKNFTKTATKVITGAIALIVIPLVVAVIKINVGL